MNFRSKLKFGKEYLKEKYYYSFGLKRHNSVWLGNSKIWDILGDFIGRTWTKTTEYVKLKDKERFKNGPYCLRLSPKRRPLTHAI